MDRALIASKVTNRAVIYPWHCDAMGHFATQHIMAFMDDAAWHFLYLIGSHVTTEREAGLGWADVKHEIHYKAEAHSGELIVIKSAPIALGQKSIRYRHVMHKAKDEEPLVELEAVTVRFDLNARKAIKIEDQIRRTAQNWMDGLD